MFTAQDLRNKELKTRLRYQELDLSLINYLIYESHFEFLNSKKSQWPNIIIQVGSCLNVENRTDDYYQYLINLNGKKEFDKVKNYEITLEENLILAKSDLQKRKFKVKLEQDQIRGLMLIVSW